MIPTVLVNVPLNTQHLFIRGKTFNGCEVYVPCNVGNKMLVKAWQTQFQNELDHQHLWENQSGN
jgi:hypothetical protein